MAAHTDPEDALTYDPPVPVPTPVVAPEPDEVDADDADDPTDAKAPKKPRLNKGEKKK